MSFYQTLIVLAVSLTAFYLLCLYLSNKKRTVKLQVTGRRSVRPRILLVASFLFLTVFSLTPLLLFMEGVRPFWFYLFLVFVFVISYIVVSIYRSWTLALLTNSLIVTIIVLSIYSSAGSSVIAGDGFDIAAEFILRDKNFENAWLDEPYFRFFPATSTLYASLSTVMGTDVPSSFLIIGVMQSILLIITVTLFAKVLSDDPLTASLALPFFLSNPRLGVWEPHASLLSLTFASLFIYILIRRLKPGGQGYMGRTFLVLSVLLSFSFIAHHTAGATAVIPFIVILISVETFNRRLRNSNSLNLTQAKAILILLSLLTLVFWANTYAFYSIMPRVKGTYVGFLKFLFTGESFYAYIPRQTLRNPIEAYGWAVPFSLVAAYTLISLGVLMTKTKTAPASSYTASIIVAVGIFSIAVVPTSFIIKLATTAASSERYLSASAYLLMLLVSPTIVSKMGEKKVIRILSFSLLVILLFVGASSYTWAPDSVVGRTIYEERLIGEEVSKIVSNNTCIYTTQRFILSRLALDNVAFREGYPEVFEAILRGESALKPDPLTETTIYMCGPEELNKLNDQEINIVFSSNRYVVFTPVEYPLW